MQKRKKGMRIIVGGVIFLVLVLGLGMMLLGRGGNSAGSGAQSAVAASDLKPVVVAVQAIPQGTTLTAGEPLSQFFKVVNSTTDVIPFGAYSNLNQISSALRSAGCDGQTTGRCQGKLTVTQAIYQNMPIASGMFSGLGLFRTAAGPSYSIPYGYVGIAVTFSEVNSVMNSIQAGDDIDLLATYSGGARGLPQGAPAQTQYVLNDIRVIGVGGPPAAPGGSSSSSSSSSNAGGSLVLMVNYQQALIIQHLKDQSGIWTMSAVLRSAKETDTPPLRTAPVTDRWYFARAGDPFQWRSSY